MTTITIVKYLFTLVGTALLAAALFFHEDTRSFLDEAAIADGVVVELMPSGTNGSTTYRPVVLFYDRQGKKIEFASSASSNPPAFSKGEKVEVLYLPTAPQKAKINGFLALWGAAVILGGIGSVFFLIGVGITLVTSLKKRREAILKKRGTAIETEFQGVELNRSLSVNGRHPFRVLTQWQNPSTSEVHVFQSTNIWFDPSTYIPSKRITVFVEKNNPRKYCVDLSFLPKVAE